MDVKNIQETSLISLPPEILEKIAILLTVCDRRNLTLVSTYINEVMKSCFIWTDIHISHSMLLSHGLLPFIKLGKFNRITELQLNFTGRSYQRRNECIIEYNNEFNKTQCEEILLNLKYLRG